MTARLLHGAHVSDRDRSAGQSVAELAVVLPIVLTLVLGGLDFARAYDHQLKLENAVRQASELLATSARTEEEAKESARAILCGQLGRGVECAVSSMATGPGTCSDICLSVSFSRSASAIGASSATPLATASISAAARFQTLFPYPYLTSETGDVTLRAHSTYAILQGR
jgi:Flp pilus assembly protein TadG